MRAACPLRTTRFAMRLVDVVQWEQGRLAAAIVPVPLHRQRNRERGFKQVDLLGQPLAKLLRLPYQPVLLMRRRPRPERPPCCGARSVGRRYVALLLCVGPVGLTIYGFCC